MEFRECVREESWREKENQSEFGETGETRNESDRHRERLNSGHALQTGGRVYSPDTAFCSHAYVPQYRGLRFPETLSTLYRR